MDRMVWWLNLMSILMLVASVLRLLSIFADQLSAEAFVPSGTTVLVAVAGVVAAGLRTRKESTR